MSIPTKDPLETVQVIFPYDDEVGTATISSVLVDNVLTSGTDATPLTMLQGSPVVTGAKVFQLYKGGVKGNTYKARCVATLNDGRKLLRSLYVKIRDL